jgi:hypothetical protein
MVKRIKDNNTTQKLKIEKHEPYEIPYVNPGASEG